MNTQHVYSSVMFLSVFMVACGKPATWPKFPAEAETYLADYIQLAEHSGRPVSTDLLGSGSGRWAPSGSLGEGAVGRCSKNQESWLIEFDAGFWADADDGQRRALVYHELGHCLHGMQHRGKIKNGMPSSIMFWHVLPSGDYDSDPDGYDRELMAVRN